MSCIVTSHYDIILHESVTRFLMACNDLAVGHQLLTTRETSQDQITLPLSRFVSLQPAERDGVSSKANTDKTTLLES